MPAAAKREVRWVPAEQVRAAKTEPDQPPMIEGYAAVFNQTSEDLGWFHETIKPGAFSRCLKEGADVRCLYNHRDTDVLGRTKSGTLTLEEDGKGLRFRCTMPDTQLGRDVHQLVSRGDVDQCSFGFTVRSQTWTETQNADGSFDVMRELTDLDLFDVGPVTFPAYPQTNVSARSVPVNLFWPDGIPREVRAHKHKRNEDCDCECPECQDGNCAECSNAECADPNCEGHSRGAPAPAKTKRVDGEDLTAAGFLIVGDPEEPKTWKLPLQFAAPEKTQTHLRNAIARFNDLEIQNKEQAWKKIVSLSRSCHLDITRSKSIARHLTADQIRDLRAAGDATEAADCFESCQQTAHQIKINVEEILQVIARAVEDPNGAAESCEEEFEEIGKLCADAIAECQEFTGQQPDEAETDTARAKVRAIRASL